MDINKGGKLCKSEVETDRVDGLDGRRQGNKVAGLAGSENGIRGGGERQGKGILVVEVKEAFVVNGKTPGNEVMGEGL